MTSSQNRKTPSPAPCGEDWVTRVHSYVKLRRRLEAAWQGNRTHANHPAARRAGAAFHLLAVNIAIWPPGVKTNWPAGVCDLILSACRLRHFIRLRGNSWLLTQ